MSADHIIKALVTAAN